ncbi:ubiquinol-cytochrome c reductase cytochrome b subunit [Actinospica acidiphila]|uniref:cytochrome bc1 complex cytochrome b subunit n=1 Tax=Streptomyces TaxID=1883 RepID=UPI000EF5630C|nr:MULTISPECIES: ubiquinol-cytochrome c reductase cytochrome b subunit [unclassified Streptomyces]MBJ6624215.1 ubiquinol-cytochrome c reductase cytochrome b subunit [Streptomyces sp. I4(2020)]NEA80849.1 ubiquinol-cytochrome c reductase cytochrome b subunit [Actinospica acidiphila]
MPLSRGQGQLEARAVRSAERTTEWLDRRLPLLDAARTTLRKAFPDHWSFLLGELALYSFVVLLVTGVWLTLFFEPSMSEVVYQGSYVPLRGVRMSEAFASTLHISFDVRGGLLIRQIHHWAALVMAAAVGVHMLRVFFTGAFRRPREANWLIGLTLFLLTMLEGFAGYSLPDDLLSGTGLRTAQGFVLSVPVVGTYLSMFLFGGEFPGHDIVSRLYPVHILLLPGALLAGVVLHLILVFHLKHTQWPGPGRTNRNVVGKPMFPQFAVRSAGLLAMVFGVLAVLGAVAQINPVWNYGPYRPDHVSSGAQPDWYLGFVEGAMRLLPGFETRLWGHTVSWNPFLPAVVFPLLFFLALYLYPFMERWVTRDRGERHLCDRPRDVPVRTALGVAGITFYGLLLLAGGQDIVALTFDIPLNTLTWCLRVGVLVGPLVAFWLTRRVCLALQWHDRSRLSEGDETGEVGQSVEGGYREPRSPVTAEERHALVRRDLPRPLPRPEPGSPTGVPARLRSVLSGWFHGDRVPFPGEDTADGEQRDDRAPAGAGGDGRNA